MQIKLNTLKTLFETILFIIIYNYTFQNFKTNCKELNFRNLIPSHEDEIALFYEYNKFFIDINIGLSKKIIRVLADTGSSYSYLHSLSCSECNELNSKNQRLNDRDSKMMNFTFENEIFRNDLDVKGKVMSDIITIGGLKSSPNTFLFGLVTNTKSNNLSYYEENTSNFPVLGLSFNSAARIDINGIKYESNLLDLLKDNNIIHRRIFSFYKSDKDTRSFYLGDYPPEIEAKPDKTSTCQVSQYIPHSKYKDNWICSLTHGLLGKEVNFTNTFEIDDYVVFNTGYDYILAPNRYLNLYKQRLNTLGLENCNEELNSEYTSIKCVYKPDKENYLKENLRFSFVLGGFSHEIPFYSIFASENKNVTKEGKSAELLIRFATNDDQVWIFGQLFLSLFSTVFDKDNKIISFYGGNKSNFTDEVREWENKIYQFQANRMKHLSWLIICFLGILFLIFVLFMCYRILKRRRLIGSDDIRPLVNIINNN